MLLEVNIKIINRGTIVFRNKIDQIIEEMESLTHLWILTVITT